MARQPTATLRKGRPFAIHPNTMNAAIGRTRVITVIVPPARRCSASAAAGPRRPNSIAAGNANTDRASIA
jgi:hypothetical protein